MLKIFSKERSNKDSRKKKQNQHQDKHRWRNFAAWVIPFVTVPIGFSVFAKDVLGVWVSMFLWLLFFWYALLIAERYIWHGSRKWAYVICVLLCGLTIGLGFRWQSRLRKHYPSERPLALGVDYIMGWGERKLQGSWFWIVINNTEEGDIASPVQVALAFRLVNLKSIPTTIQAYTVEAKNYQDEWVRLATVDVRNNDLYATMGARDLDDLTGIKMNMAHTCFDSLISQPIPPYTPIRGWAFFQVPENVRLEPKDYIRVFMRDSEGLETTQIIPIEPDREGVLHASPTFEYFKEMKDLGKLKLKYLSEVWK
ncbi:MAG TPA: hypothetical protein VJ875_14555 [Pyrinomonadaceae bacterium]|nr:hypothetical protein [Pyrinomonadaceae bacterium]